MIEMYIVINVSIQFVYKDNCVLCIRTGTLEERGIAAWQNQDAVTTDTTIAYVEGVDIYETWLPKCVKNWKGLKYLPFMQSTMRKRERSLSGQWSRRKSIIAGVSDVIV